MDCVFCYNSISLNKRNSGLSFILEVYLTYDCKMIEPV